jgi:AraC-like DNA-binding protein
VKFEFYTPSSILRPFVKAFMIIESDDGMVNQLLPDTSIVMAFRYRGTTYAETESRIPLSASAVSGLTKSARSVGYSRETAALLVSLNEGGARSFSRVPLHELFGLHVSLDHLFQRRKVDTVVQQLADARENAQRFSIVEQFLISELRETRLDPLIHCAVEQIKLTNGDIRIKDLITSLSISRDAFEKRFSRTIGTSPKQFAKIVRFRNLVKTYPQAKNLTDAALHAGYFDQAHFIKDFTAFTGTTPKVFFNPYEGNQSMTFYNSWV